MTVTLGAVCNLFNERHALPGWLEAAFQFFDDVRVYHAGPQGVPSDDGTMEILAKWRVPVVMGSIEEGFGAVRTKAVRSSPCDYVFLMDTDERFCRVAQVVQCTGTSPVPPISEQVLQEYDTPTPGACPWNWENAGKLAADLKVHFGEVYSQGEWVRDFINHERPDAVVAIRRQWCDFSWKRPAQNWNTHPDLQTRIVRNHPSIYWQNKLHETLIGASKVHQPNFTHGPFLEHFHLALKALAPEQRARDIETYRTIWSKP